MKETHYKLKHRVTALFAAAVMLCSMLPGAAFAEEPTPQPTEETVQMEQQTEPSETDNGQTDESSPDPGAATEESAHQPRMSLLKKTSLTPLTVKSSTRICRTPPQAPTSAATVCR